MTLEDYIISHQKVQVEEYPNRVLEMVPHPVVSCRISTYNHAPYIAQCIESMLMQETDFPYEIVIGEDESNDGTREICIEYAKKHPDKIRLFLHRRENNILVDAKPSARFQNFYTLLECRGKYISTCEGDDYWVDSKMLQNQISLIQNSSGVTHVGAISQIVNKYNPTDHLIGQFNDLKNGDIVRNYRFFKFNTLLIERKFFIDLLSKYFQVFAFNEFILNNLMFEFGRPIFYSKVVSIYRITGSGIWSGTSNIERIKTHYRDVKAMRKHLKKNWPFHALQEMVSYLMISWQELKTEKNTAFFREHFFPTLALFVIFLLRLGFIFSIPPFVQWWKEKRKTKELFL